MNILECEKKGVKGWKCGEDGTCYLGMDAKQRAIRDQKRKKAKEWAKNPRPLPKKFLKSSKKSAKKKAKKSN